MQRQPFIQYNDRDDKPKVDTFTIRLNAEERLQLEECKKILEQTKDSTALKQLAAIGSLVIHDKKIRSLLSIVFKNKRNNKRLGIYDFD